MRKVPYAKDTSFRYYPFLRSLKLAAPLDLFLFSPPSSYVAGQGRWAWVLTSPSLPATTRMSCDVSTNPSRKYRSRGYHTPPPTVVFIARIVVKSVRYVLERHRLKFRAMTLPSNQPAGRAGAICFICLTINDNGHKQLLNARKIHTIHTHNAK